MLSSEDAFSYAIARTEKSGSNGQQQADAKKKRATYVFLVRFRSRSGSKKQIDACSNEGDQVAARTQKREQKNLDHIGFLKANNLATLVLDCEFATKKRIGITWVPVRRNGAFDRE